MLLSLVLNSKQLRYTRPMVSTVCRDPQALSSALASLGALQPRTFRSLQTVETLDSVSNYYIASKHRNVQLVMRTPKIFLSCVQKKNKRYTTARKKIQRFAFDLSAIVEKKKGHNQSRTRAFTDGRQHS